MYNYEQVVDLRYDRNKMEKLSVQEEEAMQAVWQCGEGFIKDFLEVIVEPKPPYTTLASTIKNLERKEFVTSEKVANSFRYKAAIKEEEYKKRFMNGFVSDYFENSYKDLVTFFAKDKKISASELKEIIKMIENPKS
ncbi:MAG: transcriptional regulator [Mucilaginibacter sp.]|nr:transcriptional regulator [Mucilaginibacter sp.]